MNAEDFLTSLYESSWRKNMKHESLVRVDKLVSYLQENRDVIADEIVNSIQSMESLKLEQKEEFTYSVFKKWLNHYSKEIIDRHLEDL